MDEEGTATYVLENAEPGDYNITAEFTGDDNYAKVTSDKYNITVEKYDSTVSIEEPVIEDNNNVIIIVDIDPADATGNAHPDANQCSSNGKTLRNESGAEPCPLS